MTHGDRRSRAQQLYSRAEADSTAVLDDIDELTDLLSSEDDWARANAALTINEVAKTHPEEALSALPDLLSCLSCDHDPTVVNATDALVELSKTHPHEFESAVDTVRDVLDADSQRVRSNAVVVLQKIADTAPAAVVPAVDDLGDCLSEDSSSIRANASLALARVAQEAPDELTSITDELIQCLHADNSTTRYNAAVALRVIGHHNPDAIRVSQSTLDNYLDEDTASDGSGTDTSGRQSVRHLRPIIGRIVDVLRPATYGVYTFIRDRGVVVFEVVSRQFDAVISGASTHPSRDDTQGTTTTPDDLLTRAETAHRAGDQARGDDYTRAAEQYTIAVEAYEQARELLADNDSRQEEVEAALEEAEAGRRQSIEQRDRREELQAMLQAAESDFWTATTEQAAGNETVARIRYRQARDRYENVLAELSAGDLHPPLEVPSETYRADERSETDDEPTEARAMKPDITVVAGVDAPLADQLRAAGYTAVGTIRSASIEELTAVEGVDDRLAGRLKAWGWMPVPEARTFEHVDDIQQRRYLAVQGFQQCG